MTEETTTTEQETQELPSIGQSLEIMNALQDEISQERQRIAASLARIEALEVRRQAACKLFKQLARKVK